MKQIDLVRLTGISLVPIVLAIPLTLSAQTASPSQEADWRRANDAVGTFKRGHVDILKWEQANLPAEPAPDAQPQGRAVLTMNEAIRRAWLVHRELARVQSVLGPQNIQMIVDGRWVELDPSLQRRVEGMDELLEVAVQARKAWVEAVTARQIVRHQQTSLEAAQAANELGRRMVTVGNWSRLQQSPLQLGEASVRMDLRRAKLAAAQSQSRLINLLALTGLESSLVLPDQLPDVPTAALSESALQKAAAAIRGHLPRVGQLHSKAFASSAIEAYQAAHALALDSRDVVLKERVYMTEETVLHYNGMLKSVWDLLDETRNQVQATSAAIAAQRDFWIAETDLQWVMQGGEPAGFVSLGGGAEAPTAAAH